MHRDADETFVMLSGECEIWIDGTTTIKGPGQTAYAARGTSRTFRELGTMPSRHLIILTPCGFEGFFAEMAKGRYRIPDDMDDIIKIGGTYALEFTGPPLGA